MEEWLTTYEVARLANFDPDYIRKLVRAKKVKGHKWGQSWLWTAKTVFSDTSS